MQTYQPMDDEIFLNVYKLALTHTKCDNAIFSSFLFYNQSLQKEILATVSQDKKNAEMEVKFFDYREPWKCASLISYAKCKIIEYRGINKSARICDQKQCLIETLSCEECYDIYKNKGLGRMLLNFAEHFAATHDIDTIILSAVPTGATPYSELCEIYSKLGFQKEFLVHCKQISQLLPIDNPEDFTGEKIITQMTKILPHEYMQSLKNQGLPYFGVHNIKDVLPAKTLAEISALKTNLQNKNNNAHLSTAAQFEKTKEPTF